LPLTDLSALVRSVAERPELWQSRLRIPGAGEERWWTRLSSGGLADVWLLSWLPGQATELHDHGGSAAAFTVARGRLLEVRAEPDGHASRTRGHPAR
jgi:hypothetical protein